MATMLLLVEDEVPIAMNEAQMLKKHGLEPLQKQIILVNLMTLRKELCGLTVMFGGSTL